MSQEEQAQQVEISLEKTLAATNNDDEVVVPKQEHTDKWRLYKDGREEWRWKRVNKANGHCVGKSHESYKNFADCFENAKRSGLKEEKDTIIREAT